MAKETDINFLNSLTVGETISMGLLKGLGYAFGYISFLPWYLASGSYKYPCQNSMQIKKCDTKDFPVYTADEKTVKFGPKISFNTVAELLNESIVNYADKNAMGHRKLISEEIVTDQLTKKELKKVVLGEYEWITYKQLGRIIDCVSKSLLNSINDLSTPVIIFGDTCGDWLITALSLFKCSVPAATVYSSLADDAIIFSLNQTQAEIAVCDKKSWLRLSKLLTNLSFLKKVILMSDAKDINVSDSKIEFVHFSDFTKPTDDSEKVVYPTVNGDTLAMIMYTSGSTGQPKGVLIKQSNMVAIIDDISHMIDSTSVCISYLPLAHILEAALEIGMICHGGKIGYGSPLTLTDRSPMIKEGSKGDLTALAPSIFTAVPLSLERIVKALLDRIQNEKRTKKFILQFFLEYKRHFWRKGYGTPIIDKLIFSKIAAITGGNIKKAVVGGGPLSSETEEFVSICFNMNLMQGYGLTETCAAVSLKCIWDRKTGTTGAPVKNTTIKLIPWDEGGYSPNDKPHPRGEIAVSGPQITCGYYKNPELTNEVYKDIDGVKWFLTGDIGLIDNRGCLKIIDRRKDIVKLEHGEYISLAKIEVVISKCSFVENCCCIPVPQYNSVFMLIVPNRAKIEIALEKLNIHSVQLDDEFSNKYLIEQLMFEVKSISKKNSLNKFETPCNIVLVKDIWLPDNGLLTPSMKLKRVEIKKFYQTTIDQFVNSMAVEKNASSMVTQNPVI